MASAMLDVVELDVVLQQQFRLSIRHNDASNEVDVLRLSSVEVHGVDVAPAGVTVNGKGWTRFSHSTATQVSAERVRRVMRSLDDTVKYRLQHGLQLTVRV